MNERREFIERLGKIVDSDKMVIRVDVGMLVWKYGELEDKLTIFANQKGRFGIIQGSEDDKVISIIDGRGVVSQTRVQDLEYIRTDIEDIEGESNRLKFRNKALGILAEIESSLEIS